MNYEDFCHIASVCTEQIGPKCRRFFSPSNFMKFEKDESGRIAILPFYLYVMRTVSIINLYLQSPFSFTFPQQCLNTLRYTSLSLTWWKYIESVCVLYTEIWLFIGLFISFKVVQSAFFVHRNSYIQCFVCTPDETHFLCE